MHHAGRERRARGSVGEVEIDRIALVLSLRAPHCQPAPLEYDLLSRSIRGTCVATDMLMREVWGPGERSSEERSNHILELRKKGRRIRAAATSHVRKAGYRLQGRATHDARIPALLP